MKNNCSTSQNTPRPQVLITGFSVFPSAPVNPTEELISMLRKVDLSAFDAEFEFLLFKTDYRQLDIELARLAETITPDIAIHFGLDAKARGFKLERIAANHIALDKPDVCGYIPATGIIMDGLGDQQSTLPLGKLHRKLSQLNLPVDYSHDAGSYLCNYLFYKSSSQRLWSSKACMSGFIHVPHLDHQYATLDDEIKSQGLATMTSDQLLEGVMEIIRICLSVQPSPCTP
ncbi:MAG: hypothetical protein ABJZ62_03215 [Hyphomicrobiales bacterium]